MRNLSKMSLAAIAAAAAVMTVPAGGAGAASPPSATISGTVGENVSTTDNYDGRYLRYVGNPAPAGYDIWYQWGSPYILTTSPEDGPVTMAGTLDLADMTKTNQVAVIGLTDADALRAGDRGDKADNGIYVVRRADRYDIGVTDGDAGGGEFVQRSISLPLTTTSDQVELVVDGTADPATCASDAGDASTADGCMTLTVNGGDPIRDSYGTIAPDGIETELGNGAHPGWYSAYDAGDGPNVGVDFNLTISPVVENKPETKDDCKHGGFEAYGFKNQGQCVASVQSNENAGKH